MEATGTTTTREIVVGVCRAAREASARMGRASAPEKNAALAAMARGLRGKTPWLREQNRKDLEGAASRGGAEAILPNTPPGRRLREAMARAGLPADAVVVIERTARQAIDWMLQAEE